jgi:hypothetical protein
MNEIGITTKSELQTDGSKYTKQKTNCVHQRLNPTNQVNIHMPIQLTDLISLNKCVIRINCMHIMFVFYNSQEVFV